LVISVSIVFQIVDCLPNNGEKFVAQQVHEMLAQRGIVRDGLHDRLQHGASYDVGAIAAAAFSTLSVLVSTSSTAADLGFVASFISVPSLLVLSLLV
jgi:hypothetical protein